MIVAYMATFVGAPYCIIGRVPIQSFKNSCIPARQGGRK
jgi:hypothetical protein